MGDRKTFTADEEALEELLVFKRESENSSEFAERAAHAMSVVYGSEHSGVPDGLETTFLEALKDAGVLTVDHIPDIATETSGKTANEVAGELQGGRF